MQVTQPTVPQLTDVSALHILFFCAQGSTIFYLQIVDILHPNPHPPHLSHGYVMKECLSFTKDHIIASIFQHSRKYQVLLQPKIIHNIS